MAKVKVCAFSLSLDGFGAGPEQSLQAPLGIEGERIHQWMFETRTFRTMVGETGGAQDADDDFVRRSFDNVGAWIIGRNMFGPVRGPWPDDTWRGWWGDNPPFHTPVFVLTHYERPSLVMEGGTTFHFVTDGTHDALERARRVAGTRDVRIGGGVATIRQYLAAGLIDELHLAIVPTLLGRGETLLNGLDLAAAGFRCTEHVATSRALHVVLAR
jgi:dihydrofolate reductase